MITFELTKNKKEIIKILSDPNIFFKTYGVPYVPKARVHLGDYNYLAKYKGTVIGLLQVDEFTGDCAVIHGCLFPKLCKPVIVKAGIQSVIDLFETTSPFRKIVGTVPKTAHHMVRALTRCGFIIEGTLKDSVSYAGDLVDLLLITYSFKRD